MGHYNGVDIYNKGSIFMHIDITPNALLTQLKLSVNETSLAQMERIINNTPDALKFFKHLFSLNDTLSHIDAFIAPSSSCDLLKIKLHGDIPEKIEEFHKIVKHWSDKYKVDVEKVSQKEVYYIKGSISH